MLKELVAERQACAVRLAGLDAAITLELAALHQSAVTQNRDLITATAAAKKLGISKVYLYERVRTGQQKAVRIGRAVRFRPEDLTA